MTKKEALNLYKALGMLADLKGAKFAYAISKNVSLLEVEMKALNKSLEPKKKFIEYDNERVELAKKLAKKGEKGEPLKKIEEGVEKYDMADEAQWDKEFAELQEKYKEPIDERKEQLKEYEKMLEEKSEVKIHKIKLSEIPQEISVEQMNGIKLLVEENE